MGYLLTLDRTLLTNLPAFCLSPLASELNQPIDGVQIRDGQCLLG
jgi:hypothetical protein